MRKNLNATPCVTLQRRKLSDGRISLYLHIHRKGGKPERQWLRLYLTGNKNEDIRTLAIAEEVRKQRFLELQGNGISVQTDFVAHFRRYAQKRKKPTLYNTALKHFLAFAGRETIPFSEINRRFCQQLLDYLQQRGFRSATVSCYWGMFKAALNDAVRSGLIALNPATTIRGVRPITRPREYLTFEELQVLAYTPCARDDVKRAFLFSAWTGLRRSDVRALRWFNIKSSPTGETSIVHTQQKTGVVNYIPLSATALSLLNDGKPHAPTDVVFPLPGDTHTGRVLSTWGQSAGLAKKLHFHIARHTFATLTLAQGADLYTVSSLLGHSTIKTTEVYAKVVSASKTRAIASLPELVLPQEGG